MTFISQTAPQQRSLLVAAGKEMVRVIRERCAEFANRQKLKSNFRVLSAKDLRDIGLTDNDVSSVDQLPLTYSSALELNRVRRSRKGNW